MGSCRNMGRSSPSKAQGWGLLLVSKDQAGSWTSPMSTTHLPLLMSRLFMRLPAE